MALLLRIVSNPKWEKARFMSPQDVPADALSDLRTNNNELSVWYVESDRSNLDSALVAAASNRQHLDKLDYELIDEGILVSLEIKCKKSDGNSPHRIASSTMHRDLTELTVEKISRLASAMMPLSRVRVPEKKVVLMLRTALTGGLLDPDRIPSRLLDSLGLV